MNAEGPPIGQEKAVAGGRPEKVVDTASSSKAKRGQKLSEDVKETKLSGAELKKRAKEEKIARRAKEKQEKPTLGQPDVPNHTQQDQGIVLEPNTKNPHSEALGTKQQKRRRSSTTNPQRQIPIRTSEPHAPSVTPAPKKENKNVALFSHLYGHSRRTTMTGAGKDIHPTVVVLGLKMSHYIICGSNARCVAMLLAFTRVCFYVTSHLTLAEYR